MSKNLIVSGLLPAIVFSFGSVAGAQPASELLTVEQGELNNAKGVAESMTEESLQDMRQQLQTQLQQTQELQNRLNAQLDSLDKRMKKVEKRSWQPPVEIHGYGRLRWDKHDYEGFKGVNRKSVWLNLFTKYRINDRWSLHSEHEFENNLSTNRGAYDGDGKSFSRPVLQLYAEGRVGEVKVKLGRYYLQSPYKFTFDEKIDGWQARYGMPTRWGRKANFTLSAGNTYSRVLYGVSEKGHNAWEGGSADFKVLSLMGEIPVAKNTNISSHYGRLTYKPTNIERKTWSVGFDTKLNRDLKLWAAMAKSDSEKLNKSHFIQLQYKEARADIPGSYDVYVKKYLQRGRTGLTNCFNDDIIDATGYADEFNANNPGSNAWDVGRANEFNGIRIGADLVPIRNTKLLLHYTFGKMGLFHPVDAPNGNGKHQNYSLLRAQWEFYF